MLDPIRECPYCAWRTPLVGPAADEAWEQHVLEAHVTEV